MAQRYASMEGSPQHSPDPKLLYKLELEAQIKAQADLKRRRREEEKSPPKEQFFNFGSPGAGAPHRDQFGRIVAVRPPRYNENDPRFMDPSRFYEGLTAGAEGGYERGMQVSQSVPNLMNPHQSAMSTRTPYEPAMTDPRTMYPAPAPGYRGELPPPQPYHHSRGNIFAPTSETFRASQPQNFLPQPYGSARAGAAPLPPGPQTTMQADYENQMQSRAKKELGSALLEQMEDRRRRLEEERRQKLLEERMEETRLERERQKLQEEFLNEADKKRKLYEDIQRANEQNVVVATLGRKNPRQRTPVDMAPGEPPKSPPRGPPDLSEPPRQISRDVTIDFGKEIATRVENEVWKIRSELSQQQTDLRESVVALKVRTV